MLRKVAKVIMHAISASLLFYLALSALGGGTLSASEDFCAVTVKILDASGSPVIYPTPVEMRGAASGKVQRVLSKNAEARICDFGFGLHTLAVGEPGKCGTVEIKAIRFQWLQPQQFVAVLNRCVGDGDGGMYGCFISIRVEDANRVPIAYPIIRRAGKTIRGNKYGFVPTSLVVGSKADLIVEAEGHSSATVSAECRKSQELEFLIKLD